MGWQFNEEVRSNITCKTIKVTLYVFTLFAHCMDIRKGAGLPFHSSPAHRYEIQGDWPVQLRFVTEPQIFLNIVWKQHCATLKLNYSLPIELGIWSWRWAGTNMVGSLPPFGNKACGSSWEAVPSLFVFSALFLLVDSANKVTSPVLSLKKNKCFYN